MPARVELPAAHPMAPAIGEFLTDLANAGRSPHTVRGYRGDLAQLVQIHAGEVSMIDAAVLRGFFTAIAAQAPATRARKRAAVGEFLAWARRHELLTGDPMALIEKIAVPERLPRPADPGQVQRVLEAIPKANLRDRVLFGLIASTGLRASEALGAYVEDLDLTIDDEHLTVTAKGGRRRTILLDDPALLALLRRYLRRAGYTRGPLFRAAKNNIGGPLRYASAEQLWRKYAAAVEEQISLHQLRHGHATELINAGVPVETVRKRLGHKKLSSTLLYADKSDRVADDEIRAWRRRRSNVALPPVRAAASATGPKPDQPPPAHRSACPACGRIPRTRAEARQQAADLTVTWLEPDGAGTLTAVHHCAECAPAHAVADIACTVCGDGPLLAVPDGPGMRSTDDLPSEAERWLCSHGWRFEPALTCPAHAGSGPGQTEPAR